MDLETLETGLRRAVGRRKVTEDYVAASLVERLAVTLDCDLPTPRIGEALPPGWHTIFCLQAPPRAAQEYAADVAAGTFPGPEHTF